MYNTAMALDTKVLVVATILVTTWLHAARDAF